jgi:His-Xaa-Ser system protein HxsD
MVELTRSVSDGSAKIEFDEHLYPKDAIYGAAYIFIDRCYLYLDRPSAGRISVELTPKPDSGQDPERLLGEFQNELLGQAWRKMITEEGRDLIEQVSTLALTGAAGPAGLDDLLETDIGDDTAFEDPLGIAMSWEDKYRKKGKNAGDDPDEPK